MAIILRGSTYHLRKRVPLRFRSIEVREHVAVSLHTDSQKLAVRKADEIWTQLVEGWESALRGDNGGAQARYDAAKNIADHRGFSFVAAPALAAGPIEEIVKRALNVPENRDGSANQRIGNAVLGGVEEPAIRIEKALEVFWEHEADKERGKSADQIRKWRNPKIKAIKNLVAQIGNKEISAITRADMVKFRDWWRDRMLQENLVANSANKDSIHVGHVLRTANSRLGLGLDDHLNKILADLSFKDERGDERERPPFSDKWIREVILKDGALDGLNVEARCILLAMINTGARPSEIAGLLPEHIRLADKVPHISIEPVGRQLKNQQSKRIIPLTGISLKAFKECPKGFPSYRGKDTFSATINKFMRENGLMESDQHVLYSLRHAFEDRMIAAEFDDRMRRQLFGHKLDREKYGKGPTLELMHEKLKAIAI
ncbi:tyrosine-type recombinase/integrase [Sphingomonas parapaucimobilis]|uniref:Putative integrase n=1 Tax=Sphingomonas parapaucimobilis NBRC 15100 TaxID=1219049 RepID=A0A0A1W3I9_9SPHN|nr:tyrosine-type recombinase/integrase [Sphingomonas parapaucimobilis]GAM00005.1 putative integrase [Sphingomonas parapaucimobilis NBRC 15100]